MVVSAADRSYFEGDAVNNDPYEPPYDPAEPCGSDNCSTCHPDVVTEHGYYEVTRTLPGMLLAITAVRGPVEGKVEIFDSETSLCSCDLSQHTEFTMRLDMRFRGPLRAQAPVPVRIDDLGNGHVVVYVGKARKEHQPENAGPWARSRADDPSSFTIINGKIASVGKIGPMFIETDEDSLCIRCARGDHVGHYRPYLKSDGPSGACPLCPCVDRGEPLEAGRRTLTQDDPAKRPTITDPASNIAVRAVRSNPPKVTLRTLIAGQPSRDGSLDVYLTGEDATNNRMLVTLVDWADWVHAGWRTKVDASDEDLAKVRDAIEEHLDRYLDGAGE